MLKYVRVEMLVPEDLDDSDLLERMAAFSVDCVEEFDEDGETDPDYAEMLSNCVSVENLSGQDNFQSPNLMIGQLLGR